MGPHVPSPRRCAPRTLVLAALLGSGAAPGVAAQQAPEPPASGQQAPGQQAPAEQAPADAAGAADPDTASPPELRVARPATVNGESITSEDIANQARLLREEQPGLPVEDLLRLARRQIAEQVLLAGEAKRRGVTLPDRAVDEYWERRRGAVPDYEALAEETGTSVERQKTLARRAALAELYLLHRIGLRLDFARQIPPEPLLVRLVTITPAQLREAFADNRDLLDLPAHVMLDVYPVPDQESGEDLCAALAAGAPPADSRPLERLVHLPGLERSFPPETAAFLRDAPAGACRVEVGEQGGAVLVIRSHEPARPARFEEVQERLRVMLQGELIEEARRHLVALLSQEASCWPRDLFAP